jgi:hypothetical protein
MMKVMSGDDAVWESRLFDLLNGGLAVWRIAGKVTRARGGCVVHPADGGAPVFVRRVSDDGAAPYWTVSVEDSSLIEVDPALAALLAQPYAGAQGMLRAVRDALDPDAGAHRLVVGA